MLIPANLDLPYIDYLYSMLLLKGNLLSPFNRPVFVCLLAMLMACSSDDDLPAEEQKLPSGNRLLVEVHVNGEPIDLQQEYAGIGGQLVRFQRVAFYLSEFSPQLEGAEDFELSSEPQAMLYDGENTAIDFLSDHFELQTIEGLRISIGLPPEINHANPLEAEPPLNIPSMHWNWNPDLGYIFARIEGMYDSNGDGVIDITDSEFTYHCADINLKKTFSLMAESPIMPAEDIRIRIEVSDLFFGLNIADEAVSHGSTDMTNSIMNNFVRATRIDS